MRFIEDCQGRRRERAIATMLPGDIGVLENTRFHAGEEKNDPELAEGDGGARRFLRQRCLLRRAPRACLDRGPRALPAGFAGRAMEAELEALEKALGNPEHPVAAVVGGAKVSTKLDVLGTSSARSII